MDYVIFESSLMKLTTVPDSRHQEDQPAHTGQHRRRHHISIAISTNIYGNIYRNNPSYNARYIHRAVIKYENFEPRVGTLRGNHATHCNTTPLDASGYWMRKK